MWKRLILGVTVSLGLTALVIAQSTPIYNFIGTETLLITLGSGSQTRITEDQIRNTKGMSPVGPGTTVASSPTGALGYLIASGAITTWDITLPNPANYGQQFYAVADGGAITTLRVNASTNTTTTGGQTQTLNSAFSFAVAQASPIGWMYYYPTSTWFRIQ